MPLACPLSALLGIAGNCISRPSLPSPRQLQPMELVAEDVRGEEGEGRALGQPLRQQPGLLCNSMEAPPPGP